MKKDFPGYYPVVDSDLKSMWDKALFVFDANVLLNLYRYQPSARDDLLKVLEKVKDRAWIPYQVGLEYQRNRLAVIGGEKQAFSGARKTVQDLTSKVLILFEDRARNPHPNQTIAEALDKLKDIAATIDKQLEDMGNAQADVHQNDDIRDTLSIVFDGRVGSGPDAAWINKSDDDAEHRFAADIPPGGRDVDKASKSSDRGLIYTNKYGDYYAWSQMLAHCAANKIFGVIFVTDDRKNDWWTEVSGKTIGPRPELGEEMRREGNVELFQMYTSDRFLEHAKRFILPEVKDESIAQVRDANVEIDTDLGSAGRLYAGIRRYLREWHGSTIVTFGKTSFLLKDANSTRYVRAFAFEDDKEIGPADSLRREMSRLRSNMNARGVESGTLMVVTEKDAQTHSAVTDVWRALFPGEAEIDLLVGYIDRDEANLPMFYPMIQIAAHRNKP